MFKFLPTLCTLLLYIHHPVVIQNAEYLLNIIQKINKVIHPLNFNKAAQGDHPGAIALSCVVLWHRLVVEHQQMNYDAPAEHPRMASHLSIKLIMHVQNMVYILSFRLHQI